MGIGRKLLALFAGSSAVGAGVAAAGVSAQAPSPPEPVELGETFTPLNIEGEEVPVPADAVLDDALDSPTAAAAAETPDTEEAGGPTVLGPNNSAESPDTGNTPDDADSPNEAQAGAEADSPEDSPESGSTGGSSLGNGGSGSPESADSPDSSG